MNSHDVKETMLDRPYKVQIVLGKYFDPNDETFDLGWECDVFYEGSWIGGGTAHTQEGVYDVANEIIFDHENPRDW